jgi:predicted permease
MKFAFRQLIRSPGFTALTLLMLALGIGATTAIFSLVNATFLRPLPYPEPGQLVYLQEGNARGDTISTSYPNFLDWQAQQDTFSGLGLFRIDRRTFKSTDSTEQIALAYVSGDFFSVLGARVTLGRPLTAADDKPGADRVIWLTHETWQQRFASAPDAVGRTVSIGDQAFTVAGILSPEFRFQRRIEFVAAIAPEAGSLFMLQRQNRNDAYVIGRLKPDVSIAQAQAQFATIGQRIALAYPEGNDGVRPVLVPLRDHLARGAQAQQPLLLGAVAMLLLITCVNVANLLLARAASRDREMAVRTAIGASRWQIIRQLLTESLLLALGGGALGCLLGAWGNDFAQRLIPWELQPIAGDAGFDGRVLLFVLGVTVLTGVGFGLAPAWRLSHADPNDALKNTPRLVNTWLGRFRLANALVVAQVALALMLLIGAGLMIRSLQRLTAVNPGFQPAQVLTVQPAPPSMQEFSHDPLATTRYYEAMLENVLRQSEY